MFKSEPTKSDALMGVFSVLTSKKTAGTWSVQ